MIELYDLPTANRSMIYLRPKQIYFDWANSPDDGTMGYTDDDGICLLVDSDLMSKQVDALIKKNYEMLFDGMLNAMWTDEDLWPKGRNWKMFREWFEWRFCSLLFDLES